MRTPVPAPTALAPTATNALKFTDAAKKTFLIAIRQGYPIEQAAGIAGVSKQTVWRHRRADRFFDDEIEQARSMFALATIQKMDVLGKDILEHWKWRLEKALPETFGKQAAYNQIGQQNNVFVMPELPSVEEIAAKIQERANAALARQIERERQYDDATIIDVESQTVNEGNPAEKREDVVT